MRGNTDWWTCYIRLMNAVRLHFPEPGAQALLLTAGPHDIGWCGETLGPVPEPAQTLIRFSVDQRGIWMQVLQEAARIHVNGRRIYRTALLRCGDVVHVDAQALQLIASSAPQRPETSVAQREERGRDPRLVLRAHGGDCHGRCFSLDHPLLIGSSQRADVRLLDPDVDAQHARLQQVRGQVLLSHPGSEAGSVVNGHYCREAVLQVGDQVLFGRRQRFVIEAPQRAGPGLSSPGDAPFVPPQRPSTPRPASPPTRKPPTRTPRR